MKRPVLVLASALLASACTTSMPGQPVVETTGARIERLLRESPLVDGHNDLRIHYNSCGKACPRGYDAFDIGATVKGHSDLPRWRAGGVGAQLLNSGWRESEPGLEGTLRGLAFTREMATRYPDRVAIASSARDVRRIHAAGKLAILMALENPQRLGADEGTVRRLSEEGVRADILAYSGSSAFADGHEGPATHGGLSPLGRRMVGWMQQYGILVDLSHASAQTARDVLDMATVPVIFSHSSAAGLCEVSRNVPDDVLRRLPANGGVVMVSFVPEFTVKAFRAWYDAGDAAWQGYLEANNGDRALAGPLMDAWELANPRPAVTIADVADHIEHVRDVAGIDHVGLGSDFDGIDFTVTGLEDVSTFPALLAELAGRGWSDGDLRKVAGENFLRVLAAADARAGRVAR